MLNRVKHLVSEQSSVNNSSTRILYNFQLSTYYSLLKTYYLSKGNKGNSFFSLCALCDSLRVLSG